MEVISYAFLMVHLTVRIGWACISLYMFLSNSAYTPRDQNMECKSMIALTLPHMHPSQTEPRWFRKVDHDVTHMEASDYPPNTCSSSVAPELLERKRYSCFDPAANAMMRIQSLLGISYWKVSKVKSLLM